MKLQILSDLHLEFERIHPPKTDADVVVLAGDIHTGLKGLTWAQEFFHDRHVIYVLGNHEYYGYSIPRLADKLRLQSEDTNVHIIENEVISIENIQFLGCTLWSDFKLFGDEGYARIEAQYQINDYRMIRYGRKFRKLTPLDTQMLHMQSVRWLNQALNDSSVETRVIVTHHAPSMNSVSNKFDAEGLTPAYVSNLDSLVVSSGAGLWIHGHTHESCDYSLGSTRVVSNPRGYPYFPNPHFNGSLLVEV